MYAIVKFYDDVYYVCPTSYIYTRKNITKAKYNDGRRYLATIVAKNDDKRLLQIIVTNINRNIPYVLCNKIFKEHGCDNFNTQITDYNTQRVAIVPAFYDTTKPITLYDTSVNNETGIANQDHSYKRNIKMSLSRVNTKETINCHDENIRNDETDVDSSDIDRQRNILVPAFNRNINVTMDCDNMSANNDETDIFNRNCSYTRNVDASLSHINTEKIIYCDDGTAINNEIGINFLDCEQQKSIHVPTSYVHTKNAMNDGENTITNETDNYNPNSNLLKSTDVLASGSGNDETEISMQNYDYDVMIPITSIFNDCEFRNIKRAVKRLTFNTTEELSADAEHVYALPTCSGDTNPQIVDVPVSYDNDNDENYNEDSEYIPSEHSSLQNESPQNHVPIVNRTRSSISSYDTSNTNVVGTSACNDEVMYVQKSNVKSTKQNYCTFCMKLQSQLARHLVTVHRDEPEVKRFAILPKKNPERKKIIDIIRKMGNFKFNTNSELNTGQLIVCRRPNEKTIKTAKDFIACVKCKGFFAKNTIRHHSRICLKKDFRKNRNIMTMGRKITGRIHSVASETLRKTVFPVLRDDEVTRVVRYDKLLILYANKLCIKYKSQHQHDMIRARLRVLGRFLLALKDINKNVEDFQSLYHPQIYDDCISAINVVAGYDNEEQFYKTPAVAANLSTLIKHIGNLLIMECINNQDEEMKKLVKDFLKLLIVDVGTSINKTVLEMQSARKRHKKINLPSLEDIKKLHTHLAKKRIEAYAALKESFSYEKWISLAEITLTSMHVFNRRRAGEMERAHIEDFENYERVNKNMYSDIYKSLSTEDKKIAEKYVRFCIRGRLGRTVPVLLSNDLLDCVTLILKYRKEANVPQKNPYIFGLPSINKDKYRYLRACILMRKFAQECNASQSTTLRGTTLRKHIATHCIQLNLNDIDVSDLATFMGHADKIHREHYRQPIASRDIFKISQYLEAVLQKDGQDTSNESASDSDSEKENNVREEINNNNPDETDVSLCNTSKYSMNCYKETDKQSGKRKRSTSPYGKTKRVRWTEDEKEAALHAFAGHMENHTLPSLREIQEFHCPILRRLCESIQLKINIGYIWVIGYIGYVQ